MAESIDNSKAPQSAKQWLLLLWPALLLYSALCAWGAGRGLAIQSVDDHMRWLYALEWLDGARPLPAENWQDDMYYWLWGHYALLRATFETLGRVVPQAAAGVFIHFVIGLVTIGAAGGLARALGGGRRAILTASLLVALSPWTVRLGLSMLSDLPSTAAVLLGLMWHVKALRERTQYKGQSAQGEAHSSSNQTQDSSLRTRDSGLETQASPRTQHSAISTLFLGDLAFFVAITMRYEAWIIAVAAWLYTSWVLARPGVKAVGELVLRGLLMAAFPIFWLALQFARFEGNIFFFQEIARSRIVSELSGMQEFHFSVRTLWRAAPGAWLFILPAVLGVARTGSGGKPSRVFMYPLVMALLNAAFIIYSAVSLGHPSNLADRLTYMPAMVFMAYAGLLAERLLASPAGTTWRALWLLSFFASAGSCIAAVATDESYRADKPVALADYVRRVADRNNYGDRAGIVVACSWDRWQDMLIPKTRLRGMGVVEKPYSEDVKGQLGAETLERGTRFVLTTNEFLVARILAVRPRASIWREGPVWYLVDLSGESEPDLEERLTRRGNIKAIRGRRATTGSAGDWLQGGRPGDEFVSPDGFVPGRKGEGKDKPPAGQNQPSSTESL